MSLCFSYLCNQGQNPHPPYWLPVVLSSLCLGRNELLPKKWALQNLPLLNQTLYCLPGGIWERGRRLASVDPSLEYVLWRQGEELLYSTQDSPAPNLKLGRFKMTVFPLLINTVGLRPPLFWVLAKFIFPFSILSSSFKGKKCSRCF